ncbi:MULTISPECIES: zinc ribbon domain-containing protein [Furfurilactobacillus]|uniref:Zinc ribbon domain-containing protein n=2 Tax=Furfurilactobacillus TaxID=2767882 RepID=A0ABT6D9Q9_9LACO|nr:zinc ribbon domain-containing protein [Furfurilactobacillus milii]MCF6161227.1 zinc ribbon domain-containing protein [Furfurilactobacillus milii]MCF6163518.1 zinc ribbon domain-containing protein [Furfurilactobacillus milii]MDF9913805.1 zinc ribbon domain-containing protein [Furfurilactobacillus milii]MYV04298.1 zinc-ribbon domain-containing protein [Furfurilactobacillus milii]
MKNQTQHFCSNCGKKISTQDQFCPFCGTVNQFYEPKNINVGASQTAVQKNARISWSPLKWPRTLQIVVVLCLIIIGWFSITQYLNNRWDSYSTSFGDSESFKMNGQVRNDVALVQANNHFVQILVVGGNGDSNELSTYFVRTPLIKSQGQYELQKSATTATIALYKLNVVSNSIGVLPQNHDELPAYLSKLSKLNPVGGVSYPDTKKLFNESKDIPTARSLFNSKTQAAAYLYQYAFGKESSLDTAILKDHSSVIDGTAITQNEKIRHESSNSQSEDELRKIENQHFDNRR